MQALVVNLKQVKPEDWRRCVQIQTGDWLGGFGHSGERQRGLLRAGGPAAGLADGCVRKTMKRRRAERTEGFEVVGGCVAFVLREAVLRIELIEFEHAAVAIDFRENRGGGNGNGARVTMNESLLFDGKIEFDGVEQQEIGKGTKLGDGRDHGLAACLIDVPRVDAAGVDFSDGPAERVLADAFGQFDATFSRQLFRIVEADDAAFRIQDDGGGEDGTEERAATCFVESSDALPAVLSRDALVARTAEPCHRARL